MKSEVKNLFFEPHYHMFLQFLIIFDHFWSFWIVFDSFLIYIWSNFYNNDENHVKTKFYKILTQTDIRNLFFESNYHKIWLMWKFLNFYFWSFSIIFDDYLMKFWSNFYKNRWKSSENKVLQDFNPIWHQKFIFWIKSSQNLINIKIFEFLFLIIFDHFWWLSDEILIKLL